MPGLHGAEIEFVSLVKMTHSRPVRHWYQTYGFILSSATFLKHPFKHKRTDAQRMVI